MIEGRDIVCMSFVAWDEHWATPQQLMSRIAKHNRVLFVEQPISPMSLITGIRRRSNVWRQLRRWRSGVRRADDSLYLGAPPPILPFRSSKIVNRINGVILRRWLRAQTNKLGMHNPIFWNFQPAMPGLASAVDPSLVLFHCVDDFAAVPHWWQQQKAMRDREAESCREADVVVCTGRMLVDERRQYNANIHFVAEGADVPLFATAADEATAIPEDIADMPGKIIGYAGVIDFRLDVALLRYLAEREPHWSVALIGPIRGDAPGLAELRAMPNVRFFGNRPIEQLPAYLKALDVCMIPYVLNDFTHHIFPLKLYEYMAAGKPIAATAMAEMTPYDGEEMRIASSSEDFHAAVRDAVATDSPERRAARRAAAREHSWDHRAGEISDILSPMLEHAHATTLANSALRTELMAGN